LNFLVSYSVGPRSVSAEIEDSFGGLGGDRDDQ
jgi:hypothetical protein